MAFTHQSTVVKKIAINWFFPGKSHLTEKDRRGLTNRVLKIVVFDMKNLLRKEGRENNHSP